MAFAETKVWAIRPELLLASLSRYLGCQSRWPPAGPTGQRLQPQCGGVSVVSLKGVITPEPSFLAMLFGHGGGGLKGFMASYARRLPTAKRKRS